MRAALWLASCAYLLAGPAKGQNEDVLHGPNGHVLHGRFLGLEKDGLRFAFGGAELRRPWSRVSHLVLNRPREALLPSPWLIRLADGSECPGEIFGLDDKELDFADGLTGQRRKVPRQKILGASRLLTHERLYYGPRDADEWQVAERGENWKFDVSESHRPHLWTSAYASTGRDLSLPERFTLEFDLALRNGPKFGLYFCADNARDGGNHFYYLEISEGQFVLQGQSAADRRGFIHLPVLAPPSPEQVALLRQRDLHVRLRVNRSARTLAVELNGNPYASFRDPRDQAPPGGKVIFVSYGSGYLRLSDLELRTWDGITPWTRTEFQSSSEGVGLSDGSRKLGPVRWAANSLAIAEEKRSLEEIRELALGGKSLNTGNNKPCFFLHPFGRLFASPVDGSAESLRVDQETLGQLSLPWSRVAGLFYPGNTDSSSSFDLAEFTNGDKLEGHFQGWTKDSGLVWQAPNQADNSRISTPVVQTVRLAKRPPTAPRIEASARVTLEDQEEFEGVCQGISETHVQLATSFAGTIEIDRAGIERLDLWRKEDVVLEGPGEDLSEWTPSSPKAVWSMEDGLLRASKVGGVGRNLELPARGRLDIDLSWRDRLSLSLGLFCSELGKPVSSPGYVLMAEDGNFVLNRGIDRPSIPAKNVADPLRNRRLEEQLREFQEKFGQYPTRKIGSSTPYPVEYRQRPHRLTLCWNLLKQEFLLFFDGKQLGQWRDAEALANPGKGLVLWHHGAFSTTMIHRLSLRKWNGLVPEMANPARGASDWIKLRNRDELSGRITALRDGRWDCEGALGSLSIPAERVSTVIFAKPPKEYPNRRGMVLEGFLREGGSAMFFLEDADEKELRVWSPYWGSAKLRLDAFRSFRFDLQNLALWEPRQTWAEPLPLEMRGFLTSPPTGVSQEPIRERDRMDQ